MDCPTCSHTLGRLCVHDDMAFSLCDRCGTVQVTILTAAPGPGNPRAYIPKLVLRCREFCAKALVSKDTAPGITLRALDWLRGLWHATGCREAINVPDERSPL